MRRVTRLFSFAVLIVLSCVLKLSADGAQPRRIMRFMSFNVRMGCGHSDPFHLEKGSAGHLPECAEVIRSFNPDYVGLQEVDCNSERAGFMDQTKVVADFTGMFGEWVEKVPKYGISLLSKNKPHSVSKVLMKGKVHPRVLMICDYGDILIANSHFPLTAETRLQAAKTVIDELVNFPRKKPVFFMGDLNALPDSPEMSLLKKDFVIISDEKTPTWPSKKPERTIDYIMVCKTYAEKVRVLARYTFPAPHATDHSAVVVDIEIVD